MNRVLCACAGLAHKNAINIAAHAGANEARAANFTPRKRLFLPEPQTRNFRQTLPANFENKLVFIVLFSRADSRVHLFHYRTQVFYELRANLITQLLHKRGS